MLRALRVFPVSVVEVTQVLVVARHASQNACVMRMIDYGRVEFGEGVQSVRKRAGLVLEALDRLLRARNWCLAASRWLIFGWRVGFRSGGREGLGHLFGGVQFHAEVHGSIIKVCTLEF
jgi:hypothetical protein